MNRQYEALIRSQNSPSSRLETFSESARDPFTDHTAPKFSGLTYSQALELRRKNPEEYRRILGILQDSAFD